MLPESGMMRSSTQSTLEEVLGFLPELGSMSWCEVLSGTVWSLFVVRSTIVSGTFVL